MLCQLPKAKHICKLRGYPHVHYMCQEFVRFLNENYRESASALRATKAHNDYVNAVAEMGAAGLVLTGCDNGGEERIVDLVYPAGETVPCEVRYTKAGTTQVLWSAENEVGYCEEKTDMFIQKLQSFGWKCD